MTEQISIAIKRLDSKAIPNFNEILTRIIKKFSGFYGSTVFGRTNQPDFEYVRKIPL